MPTPGLELALLKAIEELCRWEWRQLPEYL